jgi:hypothetical protein
MRGSIVFSTRETGSVKRYLLSVSKNRRSTLQALNVCTGTYRQVWRDSVASNTAITLPHGPPFLFLHLQSQPIFAPSPLLFLSELSLTLHLVCIFLSSEQVSISFLVSYLLFTFPAHQHLDDRLTRL